LLRGPFATEEEATADLELIGQQLLAVVVMPDVQTADEVRGTAAQAMPAASKANVLVWTGDETQGYLAQGKGIIYTIFGDGWGGGTYEVREISIPAGVDPAALIANAKTTRRLCALHSQRIADPVTPTRGNIVNYAKLSATLDEAKILARKDYDRERR
jgi:hypothetical protein